uniref:Uncharacterized protein n=1 Tax=Echinococcus granulosus TaxID=6210 RepID=U6J751_ECHGR|nr:hypothetical protein EgrG_000197800 [Echinococcus granulosus]CDS19815.1 hypothetical protein EgrG_000197900 [Echinococcus granulosus]
MVSEKPGEASITECAISTLLLPPIRLTPPIPSKVKRFCNCTSELCGFIEIVPPLCKDGSGVHAAGAHDVVELKIVYEKATK